jgi:hypothetical protein
MSIPFYSYYPWTIIWPTIRVCLVVGRKCERKKREEVRNKVDLMNCLINEKNKSNRRERHRFNF